MRTHCAKLKTLSLKNYKPLVSNVIASRTFAKTIVAWSGGARRIRYFGRQCPAAERRGRFNLSVAPRRASISEGPWRYSRHASHARKLARDRTLVAEAARGCEGRREPGARGLGGAKGAAWTAWGGAGTGRKKERSFEKGLTTGS